MATQFGITPTGFRAKTSAEARAQLEDRARRTIDETLLLTKETPEGNWLYIFADELGACWEVLRQANDATDPDNATGERLDSLGMISGSLRGAATQGEVSCQIGLLSNRTAAPGELVAHVDGQAGNRWVNRDEVTSTAAGTYTAVFISEEAGAAVALAGTLNTIAETFNGWTSITNPSDATAGVDSQTDGDYRLERENNLAIPGSHTVPALLADLREVVGVTDVKVIENITDEYVDEIPPHGVRAIIWDGTDPGPVYNSVAAEVANALGPLIGIPTSGALSGAFVDSEGVTQTRYYDRAAQIDVDVTVTLFYSGPGLSIIEAVINDYLVELGIGVSPNWQTLLCVIGDKTDEVGIGRSIVESVSLTDGVTIANELGEEVTLEADEKAWPGTISVTQAGS